MAQAPALPWGVPVQEPLQQQQTASGRLYLTAEQAGVSVGDKIEVRWFLHYEEVVVEDQDEAAADKQDGSPGNQDGTPGKDKASQEQTKTRWWAATVTGFAPASQPGKSSRPAYELLYEPYEQFQAESCVVWFTGPHTLVDVSQPGAELVWRKEGDSWEAPPMEPQDEAANEEGAEDEEEEEEEEEEEGGEAIYSLTDILPAPQDAASEAAEIAELEALDAYKQRLMASGLRDVFDGLQEYVNEKPADYVVTPDDIRTLFEQLHNKRQRTH